MIKTLQTVLVHGKVGVRRGAIADKKSFCLDRPRKRSLHNQVRIALRKNLSQVSSFSQFIPVVANLWYSAAAGYLFHWKL